MLMPPVVDLNHGSGFVYGGPPAPTTSEQVNQLIDAALVEQNRRQRPRDYLGGSRVGEPCARKLVYEVTHTAKDQGSPTSTAGCCASSMSATSSRCCRRAGCGPPASCSGPSAAMAASSAS